MTSFKIYKNWENLVKMKYDIINDDMNDIYKTKFNYNLFVETMRDTYNYFKQIKSQKSISTNIEDKVNLYGCLDIIGFMVMYVTKVKYILTNENLQAYLDASIFVTTAFLEDITNGKLYKIIYLKNKTFRDKDFDCSVNYNIDKGNLDEIKDCLYPF